MWSAFKDQKHDLFISETQTAGYLTGEQPFPIYVLNCTVLLFVRLDFGDTVYPQDLVPSCGLSIQCCKNTANFQNSYQKTNFFVVENIFFWVVFAVPTSKISEQWNMDSRKS